MSKTKTVYVVGWEHEGGGGFDWYATKPPAEVGLVAEQHYAKTKNGQQYNWRTVLFSVEVPAELGPQGITDSIDHRFPELFDAAIAKA